MHLVEQEYDVVEMLRSVIKMIRVRSEAKKLSFDVDVDPTTPVRLYGDEGKIKQIILNLLTNAVKYTEEGGFVLKVWVTEKSELSCALRISVKDTGIGVKKEDLDKLFNAYERLDEEKNSSIQGYAKCSIDMECTSFISEVEPHNSVMGMLLIEIYPWKACPASWVSTSTSARVPLKFENMKGALYEGNLVMYPPICFP